MYIFFLNINKNNNSQHLSQQEVARYEHTIKVQIMQLRSTFHQVWDPNMMDIETIAVSWFHTSSIFPQSDVLISSWYSPLASYIFF